MKRILTKNLITAILTMLTGVLVSVFFEVNMLYWTGWTVVIVGIHVYLDWRKLKDADVKMVFTVITGVEMPQEMFEQYTTAFPDLTFKSASVRRKYLLFGSYIYKLKFI